MNNFPKVSVIVPNYNHARFLKKRLDSVLGQSWKDFELIYLDDASTDKSAEVFSTFANEPHLRTLLNKTNSGTPFKQWNKGVREARGEYIWIAEADDFADSRLLETLVEQLERNPEVGLAFCQSWVVDERDDIVELEHLGWQIEPELWHRNFVMAGREYASRYLARDNTIPNASAVVFRKSVYEAAGYASEKLRLTSDWLTWYQMLQHADIAFVAQPLNYFRTHATTVRSQSNRTGVGAEERYFLADYVMRHSPLDAQQRDAVSNCCMNVWRIALLTPGSLRQWRRHVRIYRKARRLDSHVHVRLMRHLGYALLCNTRFYESARALGRKFWGRFVKN